MDSDKLDNGIKPALNSVTPSEDEHSFQGQPTDSKLGDSAKVVYVDFAPDDKENPMNFSATKKWSLTICATAFTALTAIYIGCIESEADSIGRDLSATPLQVAGSHSCYALGFAIIPLVTASFSEEFGRRPLYTVSAAVFFLMHIAVGLAHNIQSVMVFRFIAGSVGSTGATMVGGTIADIWRTDQRGFPMALFAFAALSSMGLGPASSGYIALNPKLEWRWIQWISAMYLVVLAFRVSGIYFIIAYFIMVETRAGVLLTRRAHQLRQKTGDSRYRARAEEDRTSLKKMIWISCTRPLMLLLTEPIVASVSLWIGFAWGVLFVQLGSVELVFSTVHGFNIGQVGLVDLSLFTGAVLGFIAQYWQEKLYQRYYHKKGHEARLLSACLAGFLFPLGCFIYAWTIEPGIHWIAPCVGLTIFSYSVFAMFLATFSYLADVYQIYASSALAGQSMCRNLSAVAFPLFTKQMYARLTVKWSNTLFGCIAAAMIPIPVILFLWGPKIRSRSRFAMMIDQWQERQAEIEEKCEREKASSEGDGAVNLEDLPPPHLQAVTG